MAFNEKTNPEEALYTSSGLQNSLLYSSSVLNHLPNKGFAFIRFYCNKINTAADTFYTEVKRIISCMKINILTKDSISRHTYQRDFSPHGRNAGVVNP